MSEKYFPIIYFLEIAQVEIYLAAFHAYAKTQLSIRCFDWAQWRG